MRTCLICGETVPASKRGHPRTYCGTRCAREADRRRAKLRWERRGDPLPAINAGRRVDSTALPAGYENAAMIRQRLAAAERYVRGLGWTVDPWQQRGDR